MGAISFLSKGTTRSQLFGSGLSAGTKMQRSFWGGLKLGGSGILLGAGMAAFEASHAERGQKIPALVGKGSAAIMYPAMVGVASAALCLIPGVGPVAAALMGSILAAYPNEAAGNSITRGVQFFTDIDKKIRHLEMGGSYQDTELAMRQRMIAIQDMNQALLPGRRYLGQEALFMHR